MALLGSGAARGRGSITRLRPSDKLRALVAAARPADEKAAKDLTRLHQPWQTKSYGWYDMLGECWSPAQFQSRALSKLKIFAAEEDANGERVPSEDPTLKMLVGQIAAYFNGVSGIGAKYGLHMWLGGEGRLAQSRAPDSDPSDPAIWEFLSPFELALREEGRKIVRFRQKGVGEEYLNITELELEGDPEPGEMRMWRFWREHPRYSGESDSPVRGVLDLYEQLWWVTMGERADIQSRIASAGMVLIPEEIDFPVPEAENEAAAEDPEVDPAQQLLGEVMMTAIGNPGDASAAVPVVVRGPQNLLHPDGFRHIRFYDPMGSVFASQRESALIHRIAMDLNLPVEEVEGLSTANHWGAFMIDEDRWRYVEPYAEMMVDDLAKVYLQPIARAMGLSNWAKALVGFDNSDLVSDPDKGKTAIVLHKDGVLSADATLASNNFANEDKMTGAEREEWVAIQLRSAEMLGVEASSGEPSDDSDVQEPETEDDAPQEGEPESEAIVRGIAEFAVDRAREMAGAKVRALRRSCEDCFSGMDDVPNRGIIAALGMEKLERMGAPSPLALVAGIRDSFIDTCYRVGLVVSPEAADKLGEHAALTLFYPVPPPVPPAVIEALCERNPDTSGLQAP